MPLLRPFHVVIIDDSPLQGLLLQQLIQRRLGDEVSVETYRDPLVGVRHLSPELDLLLIDWQMPGLSGMEVLEQAQSRGVDLKKIIVSSARPANQLHAAFDCTGCLAVIEKGEEAQQQAFLMILDGLMRRHRKQAATNATD